MSQVSWGRLCKVTPMHSYTHRGHTHWENGYTDTSTDPHVHRDMAAQGETRGYTPGRTKTRVGGKTYMDTQSLSLYGAFIPGRCQKGD